MAQGSSGEAAGWPGAGPHGASVVVAVAGDGAVGFGDQQQAGHAHVGVALDVAVVHPGAGAHPFPGDHLEAEGVGCIAFSPLAQGMLTDKYLNGIPANSRAAAGTSLSPDWLTEANLARIRALNDIAARRGQSLAQMAISWVLRDPRVTSALIGVSSVQQLEENIAAVHAPEFTDAELAEIDRHATDLGVNLWQRSSRPRT